MLNCPTEQWEECPCGEVLALAKLNEEGCLVEMADGQVNMLMIASEEGECKSMMIMSLIMDSLCGNDTTSITSCASSYTSPVLSPFPSSAQSLPARQTLS